MGGDRKDVIAWLRLIRSEHVGPVTFRRLLERFGTPEDALAALPDLARRGGRSGYRACPPATAERELAAAQRLGLSILKLTDRAYPACLRATDDAPPVLYVRGQAELLGRDAIAMVGARNASLQGRNLTRRLAAELGAAGLLIVSGLARGIDAAAHEGGLSTGTVAVMAGGIDIVYPPEHERLYADIAEHGALVSEMPPGTEPQARHFPRRNRIVTGLSLGVAVIEATLRSGSLISARLALEQGREVFAVPGHPLDPRAAGPNRLLKDGAVLVESAADILDGLKTMRSGPLEEGARDLFTAAPATRPDEAAVAEARTRILDLVGAVPTALDDILRETGITPPVLAMAVLELELAGRIHRQGGNRIAPVSTDGTAHRDAV